jgi:hypothetical protein
MRKGGVKTLIAVLACVAATVVVMFAVWLKSAPPEEVTAFEFFKKFLSSILVGVFIGVWLSATLGLFLSYIVPTRQVITGEQTIASYEDGEGFVILQRAGSGGEQYTFRIRRDSTLGKRSVMVSDTEIVKSEKEPGVFMYQRQFRDKIWRLLFMDVRSMSYKNILQVPPSCIIVKE